MKRKGLALAAKAVAPLAILWPTQRPLMTRTEIQAAVEVYPALLAKPLAQAIKRGERTLISVGPQCSTAAILKQLNLRHAAYPFDWIFSNLAMVTHCVADDFRSFLDPSLIEAVPIAERRHPETSRARHALYQGLGVASPVFNHHDMPESLPYFERAVQRFRSAPQPVFLHVVRDEPDRRELMRASTLLPGPLLTVFVSRSGEDFGLFGDGPVTTFRSSGDVGPGGFSELLDQIAFANWLVRRLA